MRKIIISLGALTLGVALGSVPAFAQQFPTGRSANDGGPVTEQSTHKLAQGPAGLNYGAGGGYDRPWTGSAAGQNNPISGSPQDPGMRKPLSVPAR